jgi:hypothetical protein
VQKIPTVFVRDPENRRYVTTEINPGCEWVFAGEGIPTRKWDGTCVMFSMLEGRWYARREVKPGKEPPPNWHQVAVDDTTGKRVGWEPIGQSSFAAFHDEAVANTFPDGQTPWNGTYELIGPKINGDPEEVGEHLLIRHATAETPDDLHHASIGNSTPPVMLTRFVGRKYGWEGIVWHHPDGRMAKLKTRDLPPA